MSMTFPMSLQRGLAGAFCLLVEMGFASGLLHAAEVPVPVRTATALELIGENPVKFDSTTSMAAVKNRPALGTADFAIGLSLETTAGDTRDLGDLISLWNPQTRHGFTMGLRNNTGSTTSQPNWRQLQFGIDAGTEPVFRDEGRPGNAILGFSIAVHRGELYVGTCEAGSDPTGKIYRYAGPDRWESMGNLDGSNTVTAMASHNGTLYAATGKYRLAGSSLSESVNDTPGGKVYRLTDQSKWELIGDLAPTEAIAGLVTYQGRLYASSLYKPAGFFRYEGGQKWTSLETPGGHRVQSLAVHDGQLYAGSYDSGAVYRFDGERWQDLGHPASHLTQTYSFTISNGMLHVSGWPTANVYRLEQGDRWVDCGQLGEEKEVMGMLVHNGSFYAGTLPRGEVYRFEGGTRWKLLKQIDETPDVRYRRVWTMATFQGRLFTTTLPSGHVWSMSAGCLVTDDQELTEGWHDVIAQRTSGKLRLFVDGRLAAESDGADLNLATSGLELKIGDGPRGRFTGSIKNAWIDWK